MKAIPPLYSEIRTEIETQSNNQSQDGCYCYCPQSASDYVKGELKALFSIAFHGPNCVTMCLSKDVMSKKADRSVSFSV